jgi:hypothetical protein
MTTPYTPKGKVVLLLQAIENDRHREFNSKEAGKIMDCDKRGVGASIEYARRAGLLFCRTVRGAMYIRGIPYPDQAEQDAVREGTDKAMRSRGRTKAAPWTPDPDDLRIPKVVPGWKPPVMTPPRAVA